MLKNILSTNGYLALALSWAAVLSGHIAGLYHAEMMTFGTNWEIFARFLAMTWIIAILAVVAWLRWISEAINS